MSSVIDAPCPPSLPPGPCASAASGRPPPWMTISRGRDLSSSRSKAGLQVDFAGGLLGATLIPRIGPRAVRRPPAARADYGRIVIGRSDRQIYLARRGGRFRAVRDHACRRHVVRDGHERNRDRRPARASGNARAPHGGLGEPCALDHVPAELIRALPARRLSTGSHTIVRTEAAAALAQGAMATGDRCLAPLELRRAGPRCPSRGIARQRFHVGPVATAGMPHGKCLSQPGASG